MTDRDWQSVACVLLLMVLSACGQKEETAKGKNDDQVRSAVRGAIRREFDYYEGAKQKLGEAEKQEQQRREEEKQLDQ